MKTSILIICLLFISSNLFAQNNKGTAARKFLIQLPADNLPSDETLVRDAMNGDNNAIYNLGLSYFCEENGVKEDYAIAFKCFSELARRNDAYGYYQLGLCYENGQGVQEDAKAAKRCFKKAFNLFTAMVKDKKDARAMLFYAYMYDEGMYVEASLPEAIKWYRLSAQQGNVGAQSMLADCYFFERGVEQSYTEAAKWYLKAAEQGYPEAQIQLGHLYYNGEGVEQSHTQAVKWFLKAAQQGNGDAQCNLAMCYEDGTGVEKSIPEAIKWYRKAADQGHVFAQNKLKSLEP